MTGRSRSQPRLIAQPPCRCPPSLT
jgi:hypothetical protein